MLKNQVQITFARKYRVKRDPGVCIKIFRGIRCNVTSARNFSKRRDLFVADGKWTNWSPCTPDRANYGRILIARISLATGSSVNVTQCLWCNDPACHVRKTMRLRRNEAKWNEWTGNILAERIAICSVAVKRLDPSACWLRSACAERRYNGTQIALNSTVQLHRGQQQSETITVDSVEARGSRLERHRWGGGGGHAKYSAFALTKLFVLKFKYTATSR